MSDQPSLFPEPAQPTLYKNCIRCGIRCRVVAKVNPNADLFVHGDMRTGKYCANCLLVDWFKNCPIGPSSSLGDWFFDETKPIPEGQAATRRFDPECLRSVDGRELVMQYIVAAQKEYGAELQLVEIDWLEVIANWHLPFPEKPKRKKGGRKT